MLYISLVGGVFAKAFSAKWNLPMPEDAINGKPTSPEYLDTVVAMIKRHEGLRLTAYPDPKTKGKPYTVGYGSTLDADGKPFRLGQKISLATAESLLMKQLKDHYIPGVSKVPYWSEMTNGQKAALISFGYNLGANFYGHVKFKTITRVLAGKQWSKVPSVLLLYRNPGTRVEKGLTKRRKEEVVMWNNQQNSI